MKLSLWFYCTASPIAALGFFCLFSSSAVPAGTVSGDRARCRGGKVNVLRMFSVVLLYCFLNRGSGIFLFVLLACGSCRNRFGRQRPRPRWKSECAQAVFCGFIVPLPKSRLWDFSGWDFALPAADQRKEYKGISGTLLWEHSFSQWEVQRESFAAKIAKVA